MGRSVFPGIVMVLAAAVAAPSAMALETDQFTPPPAPLPDVAPHFQQHIRTMLQRVASQANIETLRRHGSLSQNITLKESDDLAARFVSMNGSHMFECDVEIWLREAKFPVGPHTFAPSMGESVYGSNPLAKPATLIMLSPTVRMFDTYLGTDKVGHFLEQGYEYFQAYRQGEDAKLDAPACVQKALAVGVHEEKTIFGLLLIGVYSNADLAANYAGFKFFLNMTRPVLINGRRLEPLLVKRNGLWEINQNLPVDFMKPFISDHWNEALNPSFYSDQLRETVRSNFPSRSAKWAEFYHFDPASDAPRLRALTTYYGEAYGHSGMNGVVTVSAMMTVSRPVFASHATSSPPSPAH
jgi:hypothetical protein